MKETKMAELQFEAPLAKFDGEEWNEFHDFQTTADIENSNKDLTMTTEKKERGDVDNNFGETFSGSLEDLVNTFDEKITKCFCNYDEKVEKFAPVQVRTQEEIMNDCQMWWTITGNFGSILPIDWSKSYARQLHEKSLNLGEKQEQESSTDAELSSEDEIMQEHQSPDLDLSDDEELQQAFDMHSLIISSLQQEPMFTADDVITEIEGMMEDSSSPSSSPTSSDVLSATSSELLQFKERHATTGTILDESDLPALPTSLPEDGLKQLSLPALNELFEELECTIKDYSETLISELALRDELEYEKELKNQFISLLLSVQKKRRDMQVEKKKSNNNLNKRTKGPGGSEPGTYLTTVIPFHANQGTATIEQLQIYIKILTAINEDSAAVPGLLTDYILKVLCPTT